MKNENAELNDGSGLPTMTCSSCQFWEELDWMTDDEDESSPVGRCNAPMVYRRQGYWQKEGRNEPNQMLENGVMSPEEGGVTGMFLTGPKFGCVHYQMNAKKSRAANDSE